MSVLLKKTAILLAAKQLWYAVQRAQAWLGKATLYFTMETTPFPLIKNSHQKS